MRVPRFSLLSLALFMLLGGSTAALVLHWPAWRVMVALPGRTTECEVSPDKKWILNESAETKRHELFDSNGTLVQMLPQLLEIEQASFTGDSAYVRVFKISSATNPFDSPAAPKPVTRKAVPRYWSIAERRWMESPPAIRERYWNNVSNEWRENDGKTNGVDFPAYQLLSPDGRWRIVRPENDDLLQSLFSEEIAFELSTVSPDKLIKRWAVKPGAVPFFRFDGTSASTDTLVVAYPAKYERIALPSLDVKLTFPHPEHSKLSPDGRWLAFADTEKDLLRIVDTTTGVVRTEFPHRGRLTGLKFKFSSDGKEIAIVCGDSFAQLCNVETGTVKPLQLATLTFSGPFAEYISFNDDARIDAWSPFLEHTTLVSWSRAHGELLYQGCIKTVTESGEPFRVVSDEGVLWTQSANTKSQLPLFSKYTFLHDPARILATRVSENGLEKDFILARYRPEAWWGVAWLPEFWTTLALALLFLRNLRRSFFSR